MKTLPVFSLFFFLAIILAHRYKIPCIALHCRQSGLNWIGIALVDSLVAVEEPNLKAKT